MSQNCFWLVPGIVLIAASEPNIYRVKIDILSAPSHPFNLKIFTWIYRYPFGGFKLKRSQYLFNYIPESQWLHYGGGVGGGGQREKDRGEHFGPGSQLLSSGTNLKRVLRASYLHSSPPSPISIYLYSQENESFINSF